MLKNVEINIIFTGKDLSISKMENIIRYFSELGFVKVGTNEDDLVEIANLDENYLLKLGTDILIVKNKDEFAIIEANSRDGLGRINCIIRTKDPKQILLDLEKITGSETVYGQIELEETLESRHWLKYTDTKGISTEQSVGTSLTKDGIPYISFINLFGKYYISLIGKDKLLSCPAAHTQEKKSGIIVQSREDYTKRTKEDEINDKAMIKHLGDQFFWQPPNKKATKFPKIDWHINQTVLEPHNMTDKNEYKQLSKETKEVAEEAIQTAKEVFNIKLDYTEKSINLIEELIEQYFSDGKADVEKVSASFGALLGEIIRQNLGGKWGYHNFNGQKLIALLNVGTNKSTIFPINKISKRIENGKSDDLVFYYRTIKHGH